MLSSLRATFFLSFSSSRFCTDSTRSSPCGSGFQNDSAAAGPCRRAGVSHRRSATGAGCPTADRRNLPAEQGARPVQCTRAALRPEDIFFHHGRTGSGWELDARRYGSRACLSLDGRRPELFGNQSLSGFHGKRPVRKSAQRHPSASTDAGPRRDFLYVSYGGSAGFGPDGNWLIERCGTAVPADRDWRGQSFLRGQPELGGVGILCRCTERTPDDIFSGARPVRSL